MTQKGYLGLRFSMSKDHRIEKYEDKYLDDWLVGWIVGWMDRKILGKIARERYIMTCFP